VSINLFEVLIEREIVANRWKIEKDHTAVQRMFLSTKIRFAGDYSSGWRIGEKRPIMKTARR
jgi:hypothetical protein